MTASSLPPDIPAAALPFLEEMGYLAPDPIRRGDPAPDPPLLSLDGAGLRLSRHRGERPVVLVFGSYT